MGKLTLPLSDENSMYEEKLPSYVYHSLSGTGLFSTTNNANVPTGGKSACGRRWVTRMLYAGLKAWLTRDAEASKNLLEDFVNPCVSDK
jgi:hypothetical protein